MVMVDVVACEPWSCPFPAAKAASLSLVYLGPAIYTIYFTLPEHATGDLSATVGTTATAGSTATADTTATITSQGQLPDTGGSNSPTLTLLVIGTVLVVFGAFAVSSLVATRRNT